MSDLIRRGSQIITLTPALASFATPYSSGDVLGVVLKVPNAVLDHQGVAVVRSVCVIDLANQKSAIDLIFFKSAPASSLGADNAAYALADADALLLLGRINIPAATYVSSGTTNAECTVVNCGLMLEALAGTQDVYMVAISRGTPTYGAATDLIIKLGLEQY